MEQSGTVGRITLAQVTGSARLRFIRRLNESQLERSELPWRRLLIRSDSSIAQLHDVLQVAFGWDDMHLNHFEIRGREYGVETRWS
jgi:hypothetical protein